LFGHKKGAFSGAVRDEPGFIRSAHQGTLFLDEIGDLPLVSQAALLRALQEREVVPVGSSQRVAVDIRVISATHVSLDQRIDRCLFRSDLYARLAGYTHALAPLRERREDLGVLIAALLEKRAPGISFSADAARALVRYRWPRNIRELDHA